MTQETAKNYAQNLLSRVKGAEKLMESAKVDYALISVMKDGHINVWVSDTMKNGDIRSYSFNNSDDYNAVGEGRLSITDANGNEVA